jgi:hypothetical protein
MPAGATQSCRWAQPDSDAESSAEYAAVTDAPETRYTRSADGTNLAYQVSGAGPLDLVFMHGGLPIDLLSEDPGFLRVRRRLGTFSRTVWFDARAGGASAGDTWGYRAGRQLRR